MPLSEKIPNQLLHVALVTAEDIAGKHGLNSILNYAGLQEFIDNYPPYDYEMTHHNMVFIKLVTGIIGVFGEKGARPILFRGGIRAFEILHEQFPAMFAMEGIEAHDKTPERLFDEYKRIYQAAVDASVHIHGDIYKFYDCPEGAALEIAPCHWCLNLKTEKPICFVQSGIQQGFARAILGQTITIEETHCIAAGDPMCKFVIHRP